jgi:2-(3-amino-3-carboxypropyl)histidine synthase
MTRDAQLTMKTLYPGLPSNYSFEIHKTVHQLRRDRIRTVALQMPEGLMIYGPIIADILENYTYPAASTGPGGQYEGMDVTPLLLADVTYGACCIDDFTAKEMGAEMIVHYGHSCLSESSYFLWQMVIISKAIV